MVKRLLYICIIPFVLILLISTGVYHYAMAKTDKRGPEKDSQISMEYLDKLIALCGPAPISKGRQAILKGQIIRITKETFQAKAEQEAFLFLICIESKFDPSAHSKAGAVGLTQIVPKFAAEFYGQEVSEKDLYDSEVNLTIGAKRFKALLQKFESNVSLALSGYNSGADSPTTKRLSKLQEGHPETMAYVARFFTLKEEMK